MKLQHGVSGSAGQLALTVLEGIKTSHYLSDTTCRPTCSCFSL